MKGMYMAKHSQEDLRMEARLLGDRLMAKYTLRGASKIIQLIGKQYRVERARRKGGSK